MVCEMDTFSRRAARVSAVWIISKAKEIRSIHYIMPVPPARVDLAASDWLHGAQRRELQVGPLVKPQAARAVRAQCFSGKKPARYGVDAAKMCYGRV